MLLSAEPGCISFYMPLVCTHINSHLQVTGPGLCGDQSQLWGRVQEMGVGRDDVISLPDLAHKNTGRPVKFEF